MHAAAPPLAQNRLLGIGLRIGAATCFAIHGGRDQAGQRRRGERCRSSSSTASPSACRLCSPGSRWNRDFGAWRTSRPLAHLTRAAIGLTAMALSFTALALLPLAEAVTISFVAPLFSVAALGAAARRAGRAAPLERGRDRLRRRAGRDAARHRPSAGGGPRRRFDRRDRPSPRSPSRCARSGAPRRRRRSCCWFTCSSLIAVGLFMPFFARRP